MGFVYMVIGGLLGAGLGYFGKCTTGACPLTANPFRGALYGMVMGALLALSFTGSVAGGRPKGKVINKTESPSQPKPPDKEGVNR